MPALRWSLTLLVAPLCWLATALQVTEGRTSTHSLNFKVMQMIQQGFNLQTLHYSGSLHSADDVWRTNLHLLTQNKQIQHFYDSKRIL